MSSPSGAPAAPAAAGAAAPAAAAASHPNVSSCCPREKWAYESCFQRWYNGEYLPGKSTDLSGCKPLFDTYRACVVSYYEKNEPDFLLAAGVASDELLTSQGLAPFGTKYPNLDPKKKEADKKK